MKFQLHPSRRGLLRRKQWSWRALSTQNGKIVGRSSESYNNKAEARANIDLFRDEAAGAPIEELE